MSYVLGGHGDAKGDNSRVEENHRCIEGTPGRDERYLEYSQGNGGVSN